MAGSVNKVVLVGNVGKDPEFKVTQNTGAQIVTFSLATGERWKDRNSGEMKEKTEWHRVVVFASGLVKIIEQYVRKGSKLYLEGQLQTREFEDQNGVKKYTTEIVLSQFNGTLVLLDRREQNSESSAATNLNQPNVGKEDMEMDDEIPF